MRKTSGKCQSLLVGTGFPIFTLIAAALSGGFRLIRGRLPRNGRVCPVCEAAVKLPVGYFLVTTGVRRLG